MPMLLSEAAALFSEYAHGSYAPRTALIYTGHVSRFLAWVGERDLEDLDPIELTRYSDGLRRRGQADSSRAFALVALRQFFKFLFFRRAIDWDYRMIRIPPYEQNSHPPIPAEQARQMLQNVGLDGSFKKLRDYSILLMLWDTGVRVSELCALTVGQLQLDRRTARIISKKNREPRFLFWGEKTGEILTRYLPMRTAYAKTNHVFISLDRARGRGGKLTTRSVERIVASYRTPDFHATPHTYRHAFGRDLMAAGALPRPAQLLMGHRNISSIEVYGHMDEVHLRPVFERVLAIRRGVDKPLDLVPLS